MRINLRHFLTLELGPVTDIRKVYGGLDSNRLLIQLLHSVYFDISKVYGGVDSIRFNLFLYTMYFYS